MDNMIRNNKNNYKLSLRDDLNPLEQRLDTVSNILKDSTLFPKTVEYKDIDKAFTKWVEDEIKIVFEDKILPTYALFTNQRFSEFMQMWDNVDENRNLKMNFKVITRENNPRENSMYAKAGNIPTKEKFLMKRIEGIDDQGKKCYIDYKMSQPVTVDFIYKVTLITNKFELLNEVNMIFRNKFSSIQSYLFVNGHAMPMRLNSVSDDSDYALDDRQYFSQTFEINLYGYILTEENFDIEINPIVNISCIGIENDITKKALVEIEDIIKENEYENQKVKLTISFDKCDSKVRSFIMDSEMVVENIEKENIRNNIKISINNETIDVNDNFQMSENDEVKVTITPINPTKNSRVILMGYNPDEYQHISNNQEIEEIDVQ